MLELFGFKILLWNFTSSTFTSSFKSNTITDGLSVPINKYLFLNVDTECGVIKPKDGLGGLGGCDILPIALSNVYQFKKLLPDLDIIGCGGIKTGEDVFKHLLVGATFVQIGTTLNREGLNSIERIINELEILMIKKGYITIDEFRGKYNENSHLYI